MTTCKMTMLTAGERNVIERTTARANELRMDFAMSQPDRDDTKGLLAIIERLSTAAESWALVEALRAGEGNSVTLICDNPDFNGQPNAAVICNGDCTDWCDQRFTGDTVLQALQAAHAAMLEAAAHG